MNFEKSGHMQNVGWSTKILENGIIWGEIKLDWFWFWNCVSTIRTLMPCIRDMARNGLNARSVRIVLNAWMPPAPQSEATKLINDTYESYNEKTNKQTNAMKRNVRFNAEISANDSAESIALLQISQGPPSSFQRRKTTTTTNNLMGAVLRCAYSVEMSEPNAESSDRLRYRNLIGRRLPNNDR